MNFSLHEWFDYVNGDISDPEKKKTMEKVYESNSEIRQKVNEIFFADDVDFPSNLNQPLSIENAQADQIFRAIRPSFGPFQILRVLGGGMGVVYLVQRQNENQLYALKTLREGVTPTQPVYKRFLKEIEILRRESIQKIEGMIRVYESGEVAGRPYLLMEYAEAGSLEKHSQALIQQPQELNRLLIQVSKTIKLLHDHGIIHRDIKPSNILLQRRAKDIENNIPINENENSIDLAQYDAIITDLGLASDADSQKSKLTQSKTILGTWDYISPEQALDSKNVDYKTDIYSFGAVIYFCLTKLPPFQYNQWIPLVNAIQNEHPIHPANFNPSVSNRLVRIALRCLEKDPRKRFNDDQLIQALENLENSFWLSKGTPSYSRWYRFRRWCREYPYFSGLILLIFLLLIGVTIASISLLISEKHRVEIATAKYRLEEYQKNMLQQQQLKEYIQLLETSTRQGQLLKAIHYSTKIIDNSDSQIRIRYRLHRLHLYFSSGNITEIENELRELQKLDLGENEARYYQILGEWKMCDQTTQEEGRKFLELSLKLKGDLNESEIKYTQALLQNNMNQSLFFLRKSLDLEPLNLRTNEVYLLALTLSGYFDESSRMIQFMTSVLHESISIKLAQIIQKLLLQSEEVPKQIEIFYQDVKQKFGEEKANQIRDYVKSLLNLSVLHVTQQATGGIGIPEFDRKQLDEFIHQKNRNPPIIFAYPLLHPLQKFATTVERLIQQGFGNEPIDMEFLKDAFEITSEGYFARVVLNIKYNQEWRRILQGDIDISRQIAAELLKWEKRVRESPTLFPKLQSREEARFIGCIIRIYLLKCDPEASQELLKILIQDLQSIAQDKLNRSFYFQMIINLICAPPSIAQRQPWDLANAEDYQNYLKRYDQLYRAIQTAVDLWGLEEDHFAQRQATKRIEEWHQSFQKDPKGFVYIPKK